MKLTSSFFITVVVLLALFLANSAANPNRLPCDRPMDGTENIMGVLPTSDQNDRSIDSVGGVDCSGQLEAGKQYDVTVTVPSGFEHALEADGGKAVFEREHPNGCASRTIDADPKVTFMAPGSVTMRLMAASGNGVNVGAAPACTYTVACGSGAVNVGGKCYHEENKNDRSFNHTTCMAHCEAKGMAMACPTFLAAYDGLLKEFNLDDDGNIALANPADETGDCVSSNNWNNNDPDCQINIQQATCSFFKGDWSLRCVCQVETEACTAAVSDILPTSDATFPDCAGDADTNEPAPNVTGKRVSYVQYGGDACDSASAEMVVSFLEGQCYDEEGDSSYRLVCTADGVQKTDFGASNCQGASAAVTNIAGGDCFDSNSKKATYTCDAVDAPGMWWVASTNAPAAETCNGNMRYAVKSDYCRDDGGSFAKAVCNADGSYQNYEGCDSGCATGCTTNESVPVIDCTQIGDQLLDLRCVSADVGAELARERPAPGGAGGGAGCASGQSESACLPTCTKRAQVDACLDGIPDAFAGIPAQMSGCAWIDATVAHAARCFGTYGCCADWDESVEFWQSLPGLGFGTCDFLDSCIEGCGDGDDEEGGPVVGPCVSTCTTEAQQCIADIIEGLDDPSCADIEAASAGISDCFAGGACCADLTQSVEIWEAMTAFADCAAGTFPQTCVVAPYKVSFVLSLPIAAAAEFNQEKRTQFRQGVADAAGVDLQDVAIKKVTEKAGRRTLLAASLEVETEIKTASADAAAKLASSDALSAASLSAAIKAAGLDVDATVVLEPEVVVADSDTPATDAAVWTVPSVLFLSSAALAALALSQ